MNDSGKSGEKRQYTRKTISIFGKTKKLFADSFLAVDISRGGSRIYSDKWLPMGEVLKLSFFVPGGRKVTPTVKVAWIKEAGDQAPAKYELGLEFLDISETCLNLLLESEEKIIPQNQVSPC